jgi:outer membrane protein OmpA-like peptidoglycan-associated protein
MNIVRIIFLSAITITASGCSNIERRSSEPPLVDPPRYDFSEILFKFGSPVESDQEILPSLIEVNSVDDAINRIKVYISGKKNIKFGVVGFSDKAECVEACFALSNRRARLFYDYLIKSGIPRENIIGWTGKGSDYPIDTSESEEHSRRNRRVELRVFDPESPGYERWDD